MRIRRTSATVYAIEQLRAAGFDVSADDTVQIEDAPYRALRLAVAYPAAVMDAIRDAARQLDMVLDAVDALPMVATGLAQRVTGQPFGVLALIEEGVRASSGGEGKHCTDWS